jgi:hypothetical protein
MLIITAFLTKILEQKKSPVFSKLLFQKTPFFIDNLPPWRIYLANKDNLSFL